MPLKYTAIPIHIQLPAFHKYYNFITSKCNILKKRAYNDYNNLNHLSRSGWIEWTPTGVKKFLNFTER